MTEHKNPSIREAVKSSMSDKNLNSFSLGVGGGGGWACKFVIRQLWFSKFNYAKMTNCLLIQRPMRVSLGTISIKYT